MHNLLDLKKKKSKRFIWIYRNEEAVIGDNLSFLCLGLGNDGYELGPDIVRLLFKLFNSEAIKITIINTIFN